MVNRFSFGGRLDRRPRLQRLHRDRGRPKPRRYAGDVLPVGRPRSGSLDAGVGSSAQVRIGQERGSRLGPDDVDAMKIEGVAGVRIVSLPEVPPDDDSLGSEATNLDLKLSNLRSVHVSLLSVVSVVGAIVTTRWPVVIATHLVDDPLDSHGRQRDLHLERILPLFGGGGSLAARRTLLLNPAKSSVVHIGHVALRTGIEPASCRFRVNRLAIRPPELIGRSWHRDSEL